MSCRVVDSDCFLVLDICRSLLDIERLGPRVSNRKSSFFYTARPLGWETHRAAQLGRQEVGYLDVDNGCMAALPELPLWVFLRSCKTVFPSLPSTLAVHRMLADARNSTRPRAREASFAKGAFHSKVHKTAALACPFDPQRAHGQDFTIFVSREPTLWRAMVGAADGDEVA